jgi:hypothetical protein
VPSPLEQVPGAAQPKQMCEKLWTLPMGIFNVLLPQRDFYVVEVRSGATTFVGQ